MTVQDWIEHVAGKAEEELKMEGERVVSVFEREGTRAMGVLEGIECVRNDSVWGCMVFGKN